MKLTEDRKRTFLAELARHGIVARAARAASPHSERGCINSFRDERERDLEFAADWDEAMDAARGEVESELHRRAVEGVEEAVYGGRYKESVVGTVRKYSDRLLELRVKGLLPQYRDRTHQKIEVEGGVGVRHDIKEFHEVLRKMPREDRDEMRRLLVRAQELTNGSS